SGQPATGKGPRPSQNLPPATGGNGGRGGSGGIVGGTGGFPGWGGYGGGGSGGSGGISGTSGSGGGGSGGSGGGGSGGTGGVSCNAVLTATPGSLSLGSVAVGSSTAVSKVTISNNQGIAIPASNISIQVSNPIYDYRDGDAYSDCRTDYFGNLRSMISPGSLCDIWVQATPTQRGPSTGTLTFSYTMGTCPATNITIPLSVTGQ
ncbi:MAG: hypothetical protein HY073_05300, partial [Deltaproteobacteria bacterium]|nr:hypothetical protein [Deltaproteobacteria bacterium]